MPDRSRRSPGEPTQWVDGPHGLGQPGRLSFEYRLSAFWSLVGGGKARSPGREDGAGKVHRQIPDHCRYRICAVRNDATFDHVESVLLQQGDDGRPGPVLAFPPVGRVRDGDDLRTRRHLPRA